MTLMTSDRVIIGNSNGSNSMTPATVTLSLSSSQNASSMYIRRSEDNQEVLCSICWTVVTRLFEIALKKASWTPKNLSGIVSTLTFLVFLS